jgi:hypothetical protein
VNSIQNVKAEVAQFKNVTHRPVRTAVNRVVPLPVVQAKRLASTVTMNDVVIVGGEGDKSAMDIFSDALPAATTHANGPVAMATATEATPLHGTDAAVPQTGPPLDDDVIAHVEAAFSLDAIRQYMERRCDGTASMPQVHCRFESFALFTKETALGCVGQEKDCSLFDVRCPRLSLFLLSYRAQATRALRTVQQETNISATPRGIQREDLGQGHCGPHFNSFQVFHQQLDRGRSSHATP